jgi:hypothetical protein
MVEMNNREERLARVERVVEQLQREATAVKQLAVNVFKHEATAIKQIAADVLKVVTRSVPLSPQTRNAKAVRRRSARN